MQLNHIIVSGRLTRDPEVRYTANGKAICNFQIAYNKRWRDKSGEEKEKASFFPCGAFGKTAEVLGEYLRKGDEALFEGELEHQIWEKDGEKKEMVKISVQRIHFVGKRKMDSEAGAPAASKPASDPAFEDDDIPF